MSKNNDSKFEELSTNIATLLGGVENVSFFTHCMTRLRFTIKDKSKIDTEAINKTKGVRGSQWSGEQLQVIIGQDVDVAYRMISEKTGLGDAKKSGDENKPKEKFSAAKIFDIISGSITPIIPVLIAGGMVKVVMLVCQMIGVMPETSGTYITLNFVSDAAFYFMPILVGSSMAKKIGMNSYMGMFFGAILVHPTFVEMCTNGAAGNIYGIPITAGTYTSSIFPIMLTVAVAAPIERLIKRHCPEAIRTMMVPLLTVLIMLPISLCVLAPIGSVAGNYLASGIIWLYENLGFIGVGILAGLYPLLVMTGMHHGMGPYLFSSFATVGYEPLASPAVVINNINIGASCLAVGVKSKIVDRKAEAITCGVTACVSGVTEPGLFGVVLNYRTPLYCVMAANFIGGIIAGIFKTVSYAFAGSYGFFGLATFIGKGGASNLIYMVIAVVIGFVLSFAFTMIFYKDKEEQKTVEELDEIAGPMEIESPIKGEVVALEEVPDQTFSSGVLGVGFAVKPSEGKVYAPFDGTCEAVFDTHHAIGLKAKNGANVLIHVGLETVELEGKPFTPHVKNGDTIKKGQLLLDFDMKLIEESGCETITPVIVTNEDELGNVTVTDHKIVIGG